MLRKHENIQKYTMNSPKVVDFQRKVKQGVPEKKQTIGPFTYLLPVHARKRLHIDFNSLVTGILLCTRIIILGKLSKKQKEEQLKERKLLFEEIEKFWSHSHQQNITNINNNNNNNNNHKVDNISNNNNNNNNNIRNNNSSNLNMMSSSSHPNSSSITLSTNSSGPYSFACLSVRSGFDVLLQSLAFPQGSQILMSSLTIKDMYGIVQKHGLIPIPIDLDIESMKPKVEQIEYALRTLPQVKAVVIAHIFGTHLDPKWFSELIIKMRKIQPELWIIEDGAQIYAGSRRNSANTYVGHEESDVSMFSFGTIKTCTTGTGALLTLKRNERSRILFDKMKKIHATYPVQTDETLLNKLFKMMLMLILFRPYMMAFLVIYLKKTKQTFDEFITPLLRGFNGNDFYFLIRHQPSLSILRIMFNRFQYYDNQDVKRRAYLGYYASLLLPFPSPPPPIPHSLRTLQVSHDNNNNNNSSSSSSNSGSNHHHQQQQQQHHRHQLPSLPSDVKQLQQIFDKIVIQPGRKSYSHHYWLFPVIVKNPKVILEYFKESNYDITQGASQLSVVPFPELKDEFKSVVRSIVTNTGIDPSKDDIEQKYDELKNQLDAKSSRYLHAHLIYLPVCEFMEMESVEHLVSSFVSVMIKNQTNETLPSFLRSEGSTASVEGATPKL